MLNPLFDKLQTFVKNKDESPKTEDTEAKKETKESSLSDFCVGDIFLSAVRYSVEILTLTSVKKCLLFMNLFVQTSPIQCPYWTNCLKLMLNLKHFMKYALLAPELIFS